VLRHHPSLRVVLGEVDTIDPAARTVDGTHLRIPAATKVWAAGTHASPLGAHLASTTGVGLDRSGRVQVAPDCSVPGYPEIFVVGDLMALDELPALAEGHAVGRARTRRAPSPGGCAGTPPWSRCTTGTSGRWP
jgi:NADH dehydrogenase